VGALQHLQRAEALLRRLLVFFIDPSSDQLDRQSKLVGDRRDRVAARCLSKAKSRQL